MPTNPFHPADQAAPKVKVLLFGASGVGKTYFALTSPGKIAVIDTEGGTAFYAKRIGKGGLNPFDVLPTKTFADVQNAVEYIAANPTAYATLVIDPVTVIYETLQDAAQVKRAGKRHDPDADLEMLDWQQIKRRYKSLMTALVNLPVHVIVVARERDDTERKGSEMVKVGVRPDAEKGTAYFFDTVIRLAPVGADAREAQILKDRTGTHPLGARLPAPSFRSVFGAAIKAGKTDSAERSVQDDEQAAQADARGTFGMVDEAPPAVARAAAQAPVVAATDDGRQVDADGVIEGDSRDVAEAGPALFEDVPAPTPAPAAEPRQQPAFVPVGPASNEPPEPSASELAALFDGEVATQSAVLRPPQTAPLAHPQSAPTCPVHNWAMRPDKRVSHAGEFGCSGKQSDGSWCTERYPR